MATENEKGIEGQSSEDSSLSQFVKTVLPEKVPGQVLNEPAEPVELELKSEKEQTVVSVSCKLDSAEFATIMVGESEPNTLSLSGSDYQKVEIEKQQPSSSTSLSMDTHEPEDTTGKLDNHDSSNSSDDTSKIKSGCDGKSKQTNNESVVLKGEKAETDDNESSAQPETSSDESAENEESDDDDDCQIIESISPSSKEFKLKQTRVHDWVQSPSQTSYKDKPSFKHNLPHWVDHFDSFFTFIKEGTDSGKKPKPFYVFQCKLCVGVARKKTKVCRVRHIGNFLTHLKVNVSFMNGAASFKLSNSKFLGSLISIIFFIFPVSS